MNTSKTILTIALVLGVGATHQAQGMKRKRDDVYKENSGSTVTRYLNNLREGFSLLWNWRKFDAQATELLFDAVRNNSPEACADAIDKGADVNAKDNDGFTPLHWACEKGNLEIVKLLLAKGANINAVVNGNLFRGSTPLHFACMKDLLEIAKLLLANGANVNAKDEYGFTPLLDACRWANSETVTLLIEKGARVDVKDKDGRAPLHVACEAGKLKIAKLLLDKGVDVNAVITCGNRKGWTPLHMACKEWKLKIVKLLLKQKNIDINATDSDGETPLHWACWECRPEIVTQLLKQKNIDVNATDKYGWTPLHWACKKGNTKIAKLLVAHGAQVTQKDIDATQNAVIQDFLRATLYWDQVCRGKPVNPQVAQQQVQYLRNTDNNRTAANRAIPLLLRHELAKTMFATLAASDNQCLVGVLQAYMTYLQDIRYVDKKGRIFSHLDNPDYNEQKVASIACDHIKPYVYRYLSKQKWIDELKVASESFKKRIAKLESLGSKLLVNLKSLKGKGTEPDMGFGFDDTL